jgi:hypothetical protein
VGAVKDQIKKAAAAQAQAWPWALAVGYFAMNAPKSYYLQNNTATSS